MVSIKHKLKVKTQQFIDRNPPVGKVFATLISYVEIPMLQVFNFLDKHGFPNLLVRIFRSFLPGMWGGRVVPLNINIPVETKYLPSQEILEIISRSNVQAIGECFCKTKHKRCDHTTKSCMVLGLNAGKSLAEMNHKDVEFKKVSKEEIVNLLERCDDEGLIHQIIYFPSPNYFYVICNCCTCCCEAINNYKQFLSPKIVKSDFIQQRDLKLCVDCGTCINKCPFDARKLDSKGKLNVNLDQCFGCGLCIRKCPEKAIKLIKRKEAINLE